MTKEIYFIRHGQTDYNLNKIVQGSGVDSELNEKGRQQAQQFFDHYKNVGFDQVITSSLQRTHQTVQGFINLGLPYEKTNLIDEINWGIHEGEKGDWQMRQNYLNLINHWSNNRLEHGIEGGETGQQLIDRCSQFLELIKQRKQSKILVCTHGRTLRCLMMLANEEEPKYMETIEHANTGLFLTKWDGKTFNVLKENDTSHFN